MIKLGNKIHLELNDSDDEKKRYRSKILDHEKNVLFIDFPVDEKTNKPSFFLEGTQLRVWFLGEDEAIYLFETEVLGKAKRKLPMLALKDPGKDEYVRIQRRQYVRVETTIDAAVYSRQGEFTPFTTVTVDISAGGMALALPDGHKMMPGDIIRVWLAVPYRSGDMKYIEVQASLIRVIQGKGRLKGSFEFVDIHETEKQKIVRHCFEKQLSMRKKDKIM